MLLFRIYNRILIIKKYNFCFHIDKSRITVPSLNSYGQILNLRSPNIFFIFLYIYHIVILYI
jgi:hypothetical protein